MRFTGSATVSKRAISNAKTSGSLTSRLSISASRIARWRGDERRPPRHSSIAAAAPTRASRRSERAAFELAGGDSASNAAMLGGGERRGEEASTVPDRQAAGLHPNRAEAAIGAGP
jgi:hypothetical protein